MGWSFGEKVGPPGDVAGRTGAAGFPQPLSQRPQRWIGTLAGDHGEGKGAACGLAAIHHGPPCFSVGAFPGITVCLLKPPPLMGALLQEEVAVEVLGTVVSPP